MLFLPRHYTVILINNQWSKKLKNLGIINNVYCADVVYHKEAFKAYKFSMKIYINS